MSLLRIIGIRAFLLFALLVVLVLPFPFTLLPDCGSFLLSVTAPLVSFFGQAFGLLPASYIVRFSSDSAGMYVLFLLVALLSVVAAVVWTLLRKREGKELHVLRSFAAYYVALLLLIYGFDKVFKHQFYLPEPNTLFTPLGQFSPDLLFWSTAGTSWSYSFFTGLLEVIAALLLFPKRTRSLGGLLAVAVLLHVSLLNFSFDVSVKLLSLFLLGLAVVVAYPGARQLVQLFVLKRLPQLDNAESLLRQKAGTRTYFFVKTAVVLLLLTESLYGFVQFAGFNDDASPRPLLHGAYEVTTQLNDSGQVVLPFIAQPEVVQRIFVHRKGYLIFQGADGAMTDYQLVYDTVAHLLITQHEDEPQRVWRYVATDSSLVLRSNTSAAMLTTKAVNWKQLPVVQREWHWLSD